MLTSSFFVQNLKVSDLWNLETIGIIDDGRSLTKGIEDELAREQFLSYLSRNEEGRYSVGLPWTQKQPPEIPTNRHVAETRLFSVTRKLRNLRNCHAYDQIFRDWLDEGIIEKVPENDLYIKGVITCLIIQFSNLRVLPLKLDLCLTHQAKQAEPPP
ncbi:hypothetical protein AVEN_191566-1 [Araneus ventricosus]|uniref:Uncharacterized protein n=1 Tax=Araneus ventricosus TaxID=182803 RepID=A0A4Y2JSX8_ARAVE|nr:hypothetical protein AVEN_191566-1 [Araneus ventricosus]